MKKVKGMNWKKALKKGVETVKDLDRKERELEQKICGGVDLADLVDGSVMALTKRGAQDTGGR